LKIFEILENYAVGGLLMQGISIVLFYVVVLVVFAMWATGVFAF
jgi:hypothetical protein